MKPKRFLRLSILCYLIFIGATGIAMAQNAPDDDLFTLGEIIVKASADGTDIAITNTITAQEIRELGAVDAAEAIRYVPGVYLNRTSKGELNINMQGFEQKNILSADSGLYYRQD